MALAFEERMVGGRYRLLGEVGRGAMSVVWRARDERLDRLVAVKQLLHDPAADVHAVFAGCERAVREARLTARLEHPHAIAVHDVLEDCGSVYLVLEYLASRSLTDRIVAAGALPAAAVARVGHQIAAALAAAHASGILHLDVTPNNVLVADDGTAKIADFGISRALGDAAPGRTGVVAGTPAYLAPEVARGDEPGPASDVYSLGATLYTALEGAPPFGADDDPVALLHRIIHDDPAPPAHAGPLADVVLRLLAREPGARPSMPEAVGLLAALGTPAADVPSPEHRRWSLIAFGLAAALAAGVGLSLAFTDHAEPPGLAARPPTTITADHTVRSTTTAASPPAAPRPSRVFAPRETADAAGCSARYELTNSWPGGAQARVTVHNDRTSRLTGWVVSWTVPAGTDIRDLWNGTLARRGATATVGDAGWNALLDENASTSFGLTEIRTADHGPLPVLTCRPAGP